MSPSAFVRDLAIGMAAGIVATWITDRAERILWKATPAEERDREPDRQDGSSAESAARKLIENTGGVPCEENLRATKNVIHYGLGATWGTVYFLLRRGAGMRATSAGFASGASLSLGIDETLCPLLGITPPNKAFPASSHVRGFLTHIIWGLATAATAESVQQLVARRSRNLKQSENTSPR